MPGPELTTLRESQDRVLEREGIPMLIALVAEDVPVPRPAEDADPDGGDGARLAAEVDRYRTALVPSAREDDNGCLISVLQAVAYADFGVAAVR